MDIKRKYNFSLKPYGNECHSYDLVVFIGFILIEVDKF